MRRLAGSHAPKCHNRSSKHLSMLIGRKPVVRTLSNEQLQKMADNSCAEANRELKRRANLKKNK